MLSWSMYWLGWTANWWTLGLFSWRWKNSLEKMIKKINTRIFGIACIRCISLAFPLHFLRLRKLQNTILVWHLANQWLNFLVVTLNVKLPYRLLLSYMPSIENYSVLLLSRKHVSVVCRYLYWCVNRYSYLKWLLSITRVSNKRGQRRCSYFNCIRSVIYCMLRLVIIKEKLIRCYKIRKNPKNVSHQN